MNGTNKQSGAKVNDARKGIANKGAKSSLSELLSNKMVSACRLVLEA